MTIMAIPHTRISKNIRLNMPKAIAGMLKRTLECGLQKEAKARIIPVRLAHVIKNLAMETAKTADIKIAEDTAKRNK